MHAPLPLLQGSAATGRGSLASVVQNMMLIAPSKTSSLVWSPNLSVSTCTNLLATSCSPAHHADSDAEDAKKSQDIPRPKLSETLRRVGFSRRPHDNQPRALQHAMPEPSHPHADPNVLQQNMTPRARKATVAFDTTATPIRRHVSQHVVVQPTVQKVSGPPIPSSRGLGCSRSIQGNFLCRCKGVVK
ncbi:hypothetical protein JVT61DRAFT_13682 [Boletus reticuloceps]|uniref:Uncharacterized protein n=1 Tax=Boletus reticuloceps TaxID=495285 RepID=A0A8I3A3K6_9AGAM|nr:hypothetical protein JVT61DRAFT_13682 [Boletus reticuloceps]